MILYWFGFDMFFWNSNEMGLLTSCKSDIALPLYINDKHLNMHDEIRI